MISKEAVIEAFENQEDAEEVAWTLKAIKRIVESIPEEGEK